MTTDVIYGGPAGTSDLYSSSLTYLTARSGGGTLGTNFEDQNTVTIGQTKSGSTYYCMEGFLYWDTSSIGTHAISTAVVSLYASADNSTTDFTANARVYDAGDTITTADWVAGASLAALTLVAHFASAGYSSGAYNNFADDALAANINKTGTTRLIFDSALHEAGTSPTGNEYMEFKSALPAGTTTDPKLTITHAPAVSFASIIA